MPGSRWLQIYSDCHLSVQSLALVDPDCRANWRDHRRWVAEGGHARRHGHQGHERRHELATRVQLLLMMMVDDDDDVSDDDSDDDSGDDDSGDDDSDDDSDNDDDSDDDSDDDDSEDGSDDDSDDDGSDDDSSDVIIVDLSKFFKCEQVALGAQFHPPLISWLALRHQHLLRSVE